MRVMVLRRYSGKVPDFRFSFDTYKLVRNLEKQDSLTRPQAVAIMQIINAYLIDHSQAYKSALVSNALLDNQNYLYKTYLQEIRSELANLRQDDSISLKTDVDKVFRELELLNQKFGELQNDLKTDTSMEINTRKQDYKEIGTRIELGIQEVKHKLIISMSNLKTQIEQIKVSVIFNLG